MSVDISNLAKGTEISDQHGAIRIIGKKGSGYTGVVYKATVEIKEKDEIKSKIVAIKFLKKTEKDYDEVVKRFKGEYQKQFIGKRHPNIAEVFRFGYFEGFFYIVSEFIEGRNLFAAFGGLSLPEKIELFEQLFAGLDFIHRSGLLHLDIKAENIFVKTENSCRIVKIVDFGMAAALGDVVKIGGTPHYIAPEVVSKQYARIDARADLFSAAVLMYYCLTSVFPFVKRWGAKDLKTAAEIIANEKPPDPPTKFIEEIPEYLSAIIMRLLAKNPEDRFYPNARAVLNALLTHQPETFGSSINVSYLHPIGDKHIGRKNEQTLLNGAYEKLLSGHQPEHAIFGICGEYGFGKSHLLQCLRRRAEIEQEKVYVNSILFPTDDAKAMQWVEDLRKEQAENRRSILLLLDDFHDCSSPVFFELINSVVSVIDERKSRSQVYEGIQPVMLVVAAETWNPSINFSKHATKLELRPFTKAELKEYLMSTPAFKDKDISDIYIDYLHSEINGNPNGLVEHLEGKDARGAMLKKGKDGSISFNLEGEVVSAMADEASIVADIEKGKPKGKATENRLKDRYDKLLPLEREIVNLVAIWNHKYVTRTIGADDIANFFYTPSAGQLLINLLNEGIFTYTTSIENNKQVGPASSRLVTFANACMQGVAYNRIPVEDRAIIHDSIAGYLKRDVEGILLHKGYGSDKRISTASLAKLSHWLAKRSGNLRLAIELLEDTIALNQPTVHPKLFCHINCLLIECYSGSGRYDKAVELFSKALGMLDVEHGTFFTGMRTWKIQLYLKAIPALIQQCNFTEAVRVIGEARKLLKRPDTISEIVINNYEGRKYYEMFHTSKTFAPELLEEAKRIFEEADHLEEQLPQANKSRIQNNELGNILLEMGNYKDGLPMLEKKLDKYELDGNLLGRAWANIALANAFRGLKEYKKAETHAINALILARSATQPKWLLLARQTLANIYHDSDRYTKALSESRRCIALESLDDTSRWQTTRNQLWVQIGHSYKELYNKHLIRKEDSDDNKIIDEDILNTKEPKESMLDKAIMYFESAIQAGVCGYYLVLAHIGLVEAYIAEVYPRKDAKKAKIHLTETEELFANLPADLQAICKTRIESLKRMIASI
jgi:serine/threonine-protein kinase